MGTGRLLQTAAVAYSGRPVSYRLNGNKLGPNAGLMWAVGCRGPSAGDPPLTQPDAQLLNQRPGLMRKLL